MEPVRIRLVANSGVLVEHRGMRFLVDGIYGKNRFFSPPQREVQKAVFGMESSLRDIDWLLYTHRHTDHFCAACTDEYAANNRVRGIYVPAAGEDPRSCLEDRMPLPKAAARGLLREARLDRGACLREALTAETEAAYFRCEHLDGKTYCAVQHCAVLLSLGGLRLLFAADAAPEQGTVFGGIRCPEAVFVTPLFFAHPEGRRLLREMDPGRVFLYHIPFAGDDVTGLRKMAEHTLAHYGAELRAEALTEPGQCCVVERQAASPADWDPVPEKNEEGTIL